MDVRDPIAAAPVSIDCLTYVHAHTHRDAQIHTRTLAHLEMARTLVVHLIANSTVVSPLETHTHNPGPQAIYSLASLA